MIGNIYIMYISIYIYKLLIWQSLASNPKLFANSTSLFSVINDKHLLANKVNRDLNRINKF